MKIYSLCVWLSLAALTPAVADEDFQPEFYAFLNGMPAASYAAEAQLLKQLGYDGVSQVNAGDGGEKLDERVAAYQRQGLKVLSIYLPATQQPIDANLVKPLANRGGMIELTVSKITPEIVDSIRQTAEMAAGLKIRVAIYPHFGNAVATMPQAIKLVKQVDHPNLGIMFNLCHFLRSERAEDLEKVLTSSAPYLFAASTNGADLDGQDWSQLIQPLDQGTFPQPRLLRALKQIGFTGPIALQCYGVPGDRRENLQRSIDAWKVHCQHETRASTPPHSP